MACTKEELKSRIESTPVASNGKAMFSPELRRDAVEYAKEQVKASGASLGDIATELGLNGWTLMRWNQNERKARSGGGAAFVEVTARKKRGRPAKAAVVVTAPSFEVTCPSGHEVRVPAAFEARALRELLAVLEGR
jgi:transposase-like protein